MQSPKPLLDLPNRMMMTTRLNKFFFLTFVVFFGLTNNAIPQKPKPPKGKYCQDLGFAWHCLDFKVRGKCKITFGHSFWIKEYLGKWTSKADTIILIRLDVKPSTKDTSYYYLKSDTLYSILYQGKIARRGDALVK